MSDRFLKNVIPRLLLLFFMESYNVSHWGTERYASSAHLDEERPFL